MQMKASELPGPQGKVNSELPTPLHVCQTYRVLPFKCQLVTGDDKYDDGREMKTLISEELWQHLKPLDGQEKMTTSTSSSILHLDVTE